MTNNFTDVQIFNHQPPTTSTTSITNPSYIDQNSTSPLSTMAGISSKHHSTMPPSEHNLDLEPHQAKVSDTIESLTEELRKTKLALLGAEIWINKAVIENLDTAESHAEQLDAVRADYREEIASQENRILNEHQDHQNNLYTLSREYETKLFAKSQEYAAEIYAQSRGHASDLYAHSQEHAAGLHELFQKNEAEVLQLNKERLLLVEQHYIVLQTQKEEQRDRFVPGGNTQASMRKQHAEKLQAQSERYEAMIGGLKKELSDKEHARKAVVVEYLKVLEEARKLSRKAATAEKLYWAVIDTEAQLVTQNRDHGNFLSTQASNHKDALSAQVTLYESIISAVKLELEKLKRLNGHLKRENKGLKENTEKKEAQGAIATLSKAKATLVELETKNRGLENRLKASESTTKEFFEEMALLKANAQKVRPLLRVADEIRSRTMMQACRQLGMETSLNDSERHICDQVIERGNIVAHELDGDLDYLIFEQNLVGGTLWDSRFHRLYEISVNDWQSLSQIQKIVSNARALLKSRGIKPATLEARSEVENILRHLKVLEPGEPNSEEVQTVLNQLSIARERFVELDRGRG